MLVAVQLNKNETITLTDTPGNSYATDATRLVGTRNLHVARAILSSGLVSGNTITVTQQSASGNLQMIASAQAYASTLGWGGLDRSASAADTSGASTAPSSGATAATAHADELVYGAISQVLAGLTAAHAAFTAGAGYTPRTASALSSSSNGCRVHPEDTIVSSTGAQTAGGTFSTGKAWGAIVLTYNEAVAASGTPRFAGVIGC